MIRNLLLTLIIGLCAFNYISGQAAETECSAAEAQALCDLDDINGAMFTNPDPSMAEPPPGALCGGGVFNNPGWWSFVAGSTEIVLTVTPQPGTCDTTANGNTGIQVALWEGCPEGDGECVAGDANCSDQPITLSAMDLTIGQVYNLTIDGCDGSVCTVEIAIDQNQPFDIPGVDEVDLNEPEYNVRGGCESALEDGTFCAGLEILLNIDDDVYESLGAEWTWTFDAVSGNADPSTVEWSSGSFSGTGSPAVIGDLDGELGASVISMVFTNPGVYEVCLIQVDSECDNESGENCVEITIITPGDQDFGVYEVCRLDLLAGWEVPEEDENGNPWGGGEIGLGEVENAQDGFIERMVSDDCGCDFNQFVQIIPVGSLDREDVVLQLLPCQLPYDWFDLTIDNFEDYIDGEDEVLNEGSAQSDYEGERCDSLVNLRVVPLSFFDSIQIGPCTPSGTEFTFFFGAEDIDGEDIDFLSFEITWIDSTTNMEVSNTQTATLGSGTYYINISGFIADPNYSDLAGNDQESLCDFTFGPYQLEGGSSEEPMVLPYDTTLCQSELGQIVFVLDTVPDTNYDWIVPQNIPFTINQNGDSLIVDWTAAMPGDTVMVAAANGCGTSDSIPLPIEVLTADAPSVTAADEGCVSDELTVEFTGDPSLIQTFEWDFGTGMVTSGDAAGAGPLGVTFPMSGSYTYFLTITDLEGCQASEMFEVTIEDPIEVPEINCMGDTDNIVFSWNDVPGAENYVVNTIDIPGGATGSLTGQTEFTVTGLNPNDQVTIELVAESSTPCGNVSVEQTCLASSCNLVGVNAVFFPDDLAFCQQHPDNQVVDFEHSFPMNITGSYSGPGIIDAAEGLFDPNDSALQLGENTIVFTYMDSNCAAEDSITVMINEIPVADFTPSAMVVCEDEVFTLEGFNNDPNAVFDYGSDFSGDFSGLSYSTPGVKEIQLVVIDPMTSCGDSITQQVEVLENIEEPVVTCTPGIDFVNFNWTDVNGVTDYDVEVMVNSMVVSSGMQSNTDFSQMNLSEGDEVSLTLTVIADNGCGMFTVNETCFAQTCQMPDIDLMAATQSFCSNGNLSPVAIQVMVDGQVATGEFSGPGITDPNLNQFDPSAAGAGMHTVTFAYTNPFDNCITTETIDFEVNEVPQPDFNLDRTSLCVDDVALITSQPLPPDINEVWDYQTIDINPLSPTETEVSYNAPGNYNITLEYSIPGCPPNQLTQSVTVTDTITFPNLRCEDSGTDFIEFGWNDQTLVDEYEIYINGDLVGTQATTGYMLDGLEPETTHEITVVAVDMECGSRTVSLTCETPSCVPPTISANIPAQQCYEPGSGPISLDVMVESNSGIQGNYIWDTPLVDANNMFTPLAGDQTYDFNIIYTENNCETIEPVSFTINEVPGNTLDMSVDQQVICVTSTITVTAQDAGLTDEFAAWDFGDPSLVDATGVGFGPYELSFAQAGSYDISLTVENDGCFSEERSVTIVVEEELIPPAITCENEGVFSLDFSWDAVDCASGYIVFVDGVEAATIQGTSYSLSGLAENQQVDVQVEAISECACSNVMSSVAACSTTSCPSTSFTVSNFDNEICLDVTASPFEITISPDDLAGSGMGSWSGDPISDPSGTVDPSLVGAGTYMLLYEYEESGCNYSYMTEITFNEAPGIDIIEVMDPACPTDNFGYIEVTGTGGQPTYMYSIDQGALQMSGEFGDVSPGTHVIDIEDANGCIYSTTVNVAAAPQVNASVSGPVSVVIDNDATFTLNTNAPNIDNIVWTANGNVVCQGANCMEYTFFGAISDADIVVEVFYNNGCYISADAFLDVKEIQAFYIPNMFSPTSSDVNATWNIYTKGSETFVKSVKVYNRWGNLVHTVDINDTSVEDRKVFEIWDGYIEDNPAVTEVYVYLVELEIEGIPRQLTGSVTVIR